MHFEDFPFVLVLRVNPETTSTVVLLLKVFYSLKSNETQIYMALRGSRNLFDVIFTKIKDLKKARFANQN